NPARTEIARGSRATGPGTRRTMTFPHRRAAAGASTQGCAPSAVRPVAAGDSFPSSIALPGDRRASRSPSARAIPAGVARRRLAAPISGGVNHPPPQGGTAMNSVQLIGRLTRDPELRSTSGGKSVGNLRLAVDRRDRDADPVYIDVVCWDGLAETCAQYLAKGRQVAVSGRLD